MRGWSKGLRSGKIGLNEPLVCGQVAAHKRLAHCAMIGLPSMTGDKHSVRTAIIGAVGLILAAIIGAVLQPSWWKSEHASNALSTWVIAGAVVDQATNQGIGQATISIVGRAETFVTEDNGNFRIELRANLPTNGTVRIHVAKPGYLQYDGTTAPTETLIIQLRKT